MVFGGFLICKLGEGMLRSGWFCSQFLHRFGWAQQISAYIAVTGDYELEAVLYKPFVKADWFGSCLIGASPIVSFHQAAWIKLLEVWRRQ